MTMKVRLLRIYAFPRGTVLSFEPEDEAIVLQLERYGIAERIGPHFAVDEPPETRANGRRGKMRAASKQ